MSETRIKIKELEMNGETAIRIAECLKKHEPEIWKVLSGELKKALRIHDVIKSVCNGKDNRCDNPSMDRNGNCRNCEGDMQTVL